MLFSSTVFLFLFLPIVLALYFLLGKWFRNLILLVASLFFYAWGEKLLVGLMLTSIAGNYVFGLWIAGSHEETRKKLAVGVAIAFNLGLLVLFKYAGWLWDSLSAVLVFFGWSDQPMWPLAAYFSGDDFLRETFTSPGGGIRLPLGISFFTFQSMSYVIDVYRGQGGVQKNPIDFAVYIALFPQLIAGPIVRYRDIALQIRNRVITRPGFAYGARRFIIGLGKKMLVANVAAVAADAIFAIPADEVPTGVAWLGAICFMVQAYFDFSGYSDMAIGLGRMFGFRFLENFSFPYAAKSLTDFWRRWHISLSSWFRDYLYIPMGGNRHGAVRTLFNLVTVFFLCGLWHGASWSYVVWGLFMGAFLVFERIGLRSFMDRRPDFMRHVYLLLLVAVGWVIFRSPDMGYAVTYLKAMSGFGAPAGAYEVGLYLDPVTVWALVAGVIGSMPWLPRLVARVECWAESGARLRLRLVLELTGHLALAAIFLLSAMELSAGTYNPFIYFRF